MMQFMLCHNNITQVGGQELLEQWRNNPDSWIWLDLQDEPAEQERAFLIEHFVLDNGAIIEAQRERHPPSFEAFENYIYLLLKPLDAESDSLDFSTLQLAMFAGEGFLVTRHSKASPYLAKLWATLESDGCAENLPISIVTVLSRRVAQRYGNILLNLEQRLDIIEDELFDSHTDTLMKELVGYNTSLRKMHRILAYHENVFDKLRRQMHKNTQYEHDEFDDIYALIERFSSLSGVYQNVITDLIEAYISLNSHRLNQIMKVLTIITAIFVPLTLLVGIYGMNFEYMPELKSEHGYFILLSVMLGIAFLMLYIFKRARWL
ncbi:MAG: magnesium transporter CorA family protein [Gammaproteobacteria bacterium]|jgi:magnesium transporter|nr:magnesium transporter CorA family protein [Gammaproteobacteria bacterium]